MNRLLINPCDVDQNVLDYLQNLTENVIQNLNMITNEPTHSDSQITNLNQRSSEIKIISDIQIRPYYI